MYTNFGRNYAHAGQHLFQKLHRKKTLGSGRQAKNPKDSGERKVGVPSELILAELILADASSPRPRQLDVTDQSLSDHPPMLLSLPVGYYEQLKW